MVKTIWFYVSHRMIMANPTETTRTVTTDADNATTAAATPPL